jgi:predicted SprT family Zn-dependent metalloprotease
VLVERVAPKLEAQRQAAKKKQADKEKRARATQARHREAKKHKTRKINEVRTTGREGFDIEREGAKIWKLLEPYHNGKVMPAINVQQRGIKVEGDRVWMSRGRYAGLAYVGQDKIWLEALPQWETVAHELVHMAVGVRQGQHNRKAHDKVFYDCLRDVTQRRFKISISFYGVTRYGYAVDTLIQNQLNATTYAETWKKK